MKLLVGLAATIAVASSLTCDMAKVPTNNMVCIEPEYIEGCHQYKSAQMCNQCQFNYKLLQNGRCQYQQNNNEQCCLQRSQTGACMKCNTGLHLIQNKCVQIKIVGCLEKDANAKCINCASDYVLQNGMCVHGIKNCDVYQDQQKKTCLQCKQNYSLINNACLQNHILGCKVEQDHGCQACFSPFKLKQGHCDIQNCKSFNDFGCTACECGFYLTSEKVCSQMIPGCLRYQRGYCTDCLKNFKLKGSVCDIDGCQKISGNQCKKCKQNFVINKEGGCDMINCLEWNNEKCLTCAQGYFYENGNCVENKVNDSSNNLSGLIIR